MAWPDTLWNALREGVYGPQADRLVLVRYESLTTNPEGTLAAIYDAIGEPLFAHDPEHIEPASDMVAFDVRLGTPGLHNVRPSVRFEKRPTVLPPDLFAKFERDAFWEDKTSDFAHGADNLAGTSCLHRKSPDFDVRF